MKTVSIIYMVGIICCLLFSCKSDNAHAGDSSKATAKGEEVLTSEPVIAVDTTAKEKVVPLNPKKVVTKDECNETYQTYKGLIEAYLKDQSDSNLDELFEFSEEPLFIKCKENPAYVKEFNKLDKMLE